MKFPWSFPSLKNVGLFLLTVVGNPMWVMLAWGTSSYLIGFKSVSGNVYQAYPIALPLFSILFAYLRFLFWYDFHKLHAGETSLMSKQAYMLHFARKHLINIVGLPVSLIYTLPLEGNALGIIVSPLSLGIGLILTITIGLKLRKLK